MGGGGGGGGGIFRTAKAISTFFMFVRFLTRCSKQRHGHSPSKQTSHEHNPQASKNLTSTTRVYINYRLLDTDTLPYHLAQRLTSCKLITVFLCTKTKINTKQQRERERERDPSRQPLPCDHCSSLCENAADAGTPGRGGRCRSCYKTLTQVALCVCSHL